MIVEPTTNRSAGGVRLEFALPLAVLLLLAVALGIALSRRAHFFKSGDTDIPIRFVGVRPDWSDDLLDANGKKIGDLFYDGAESSYGNSNQMAREFIFEVTNRVLLAPVAQIVPSDGAFFSSSTVFEWPLPDGRFRWSLLARLPTTHPQRFLLWRRLTPTKSVDVTLRYLTSEPRQVNATFTGPFELNRKMTAQQHVLEPRPPAKGSSPADAWFHLDTPLQISFNTSGTVVIQDRSGERHLARMRSLSGSRNGTQLDFYVPGLSLGEVAKVTVEELRSKTFHNIRVSYPDRPPRMMPAYQQKLAVAMGRTNTLTGSINFTNAIQALQMIDLVRGNSILNAWSVIRYRDSNRGREGFSHLPTAWQERIHRAALHWAGAANPAVRAAGIGLGLKGRWPEFVPPAMEMLMADDDTLQREAVAGLSDAAPILSTNQIRQLGKILASDRAPRSPRPLIEALAKLTNNPAATAVLSNLALDERTWIWWGTLEALPERAFEGNNNPLLRERLPLVHRNASTKAAANKLPALLTVDLERHDHRAFAKIYLHMVARSDRALATDAIVAFLSECHPMQSDRYLIVRMIRQLNQWHGTDFGDFPPPPDGSFAYNLKESDWEKIISEIQAWRDRRNLEAVVPRLSP